MYLIAHNHRFRIIWNFIMLAGILAFLFRITYRVVFGTFVADGLYVVLISLFVIDIGLNFVTKVKAGHIRLEMPQAIARNYLSTAFVIDVVAALPVEVILTGLLGLVSGGHFDYRTYLLLQALTLFKLFKAGRIFKELQEALGLIPAVQRLVIFSYWLVAVIHLIALGWIVIGAGEVGRTPGDQYIRAMYWAITTISTIGYGDYTPDHDSNRQIIYTGIIQLFGVAMFSYVIANVSSLVANLDVAKSAYRRRLEEINAFLHAQRIPADLQERVRDYYSYLWERQRGVSSTQMLNEFPRNLSREILLFLNREVLDHVALFKGADELFIREAVEQLKPEVFLPGEYIIRQGEFGDCMYFLTSGEVQVLVGSAEVARLGPGSPFGETALIENVHRNASVVSISYSTGYRLSKADFDELRSKYPEFDRQVRAVVEKRKG